MILVFGGTTEGRAAVEVLGAAGKPYYYSTRGKGQVIDCPHGEHVTGAMDAGQIEVFCREHGVCLLVDAAHPFAVELHRNIAEASKNLGLPVIRYERIYPPRRPEWVWCDSYDDAIARLEERGVRKLLALSGVQTIPRLRAWWRQHPTWFRVLDRPESRALALKYGFPEEKLVYFKEGDDGRLLQELHPDAILTKESGETGYFEEKTEAAAQAGVAVFVIKRPVLPEGFYVVNGKQGFRYRVERLLPGFFPLRTGFTTGTTACAAAKAALMALLTGESLERVTVTLPAGEDVELSVAALRWEGKAVTGVVIKDAGDDPDVTNGREIWATVEWSDLPGVHFKAGKGVGTVTLPGVGLPVGEPAINPVPRRMITGEIEKLLQAAGKNRGVWVAISVPGGEELAAKTFNPKLGIVGGISILGTSGVVRPFSSEAFVATIRKEIQVARALGCCHIVINSGAKSERVLRARFTDLPTQAFIHYGNYIGETLKIATEEGVESVTMGIMLGKAVKLAEGHADTHSRQVVMNRDFIASLAAQAGCTGELCDRICQLSLARELWTLLPPEHPFFQLIVRKCEEVCHRFYPHGNLELLLLPELSPD